jgi:hypothetical protein
MRDSTIHRQIAIFICHLKFISDIPLTLRGAEYMHLVAGIENSSKPLGYTTTSRPLGRFRPDWALGASLVSKSHRSFRRLLLPDSHPVNLIPRNLPLRTLGLAPRILQLHRKLKYITRTLQKRGMSKQLEGRHIL